jgi:hypothetical protein
MKARFALLLPLLALTACTIPGAQDTEVSDNRVIVDSYYMHHHVRVGQVVTQRVGAGQLKVAFDVRSLEDSDFIVEYQYSFRSRGINSETPSAWIPVRLPRKGSAPIEFTSYTPADDFRVQLRSAR